MLPLLLLLSLFLKGLLDRKDFILLTFEEPGYIISEELFWGTRRPLSSEGTFFQSWLEGARSKLIRHLNAFLYLFEGFPILKHDLMP